MSNQLKMTRYTTTEGHLWIARKGSLVAGASTRDDAKLKLNGFIPYTRGMHEKYAPLTGKAPILIVGSNTYLRTRLPFHVVQGFDVHLFLCPTSDTVWRLSAALFSRLDQGAAPIYVSVGGADIQTQLSELVYAIACEGAIENSDEVQALEPYEVSNG